MNNKKYDMNIQKHFLNQLFLFESRLNKTGLGAKSTTFSEVSNDNDNDEILIRNTYLNGLENKIPSRPYTSNNEYKSESNRKILWADKNDNNRKDLLCNINPQRELYFIKDIKPITNHKRMMPLKSSLKKRAFSAQGSRSPLIDKSRVLQNLLTSNINQNSHFVSVKNNYSPSIQNSVNNTSSIIDNRESASVYNKTSKLNNDQNINNYSNGNFNLNNYGVGISLFFIF